MKINIETIPHDKQRYPTCGDWWWDDRNTLQIRVSRMSNWKCEMAVAIHELFEALWCKAACVDEKIVTQFDLQHTRHDVNPGDCKEAPYFTGHQIANEIEKAAHNAWSWAEYDREVGSL